MAPEEMAAALLARGYEECPGFIDKDRTLNVGDRVRKNNQRFGYDTGTGTIERIFVKEKSAWSQTYRADDVELIVKNDDGTYSFVANYHVSKVSLDREEN